MAELTKIEEKIHINGNVAEIKENMDMGIEEKETIVLEEAVEEVVAEAGLEEVSNENLEVTTEEVGSEEAVEEHDHENLEISTKSEQVQLNNEENVYKSNVLLETTDLTWLVKALVDPATKRHGGYLIYAKDNDGNVYVGQKNWVVKRSQLLNPSTVKIPGYLDIDCEITDDQAVAMKARLDYLIATNAIERVKAETLSIQEVYQDLMTLIKNRFSAIQVEYQKACESGVNYTAEIMTEDSWYRVQSAWLKRVLADHYGYTLNQFKTAMKVWKPELIETPSIGKYFRNSINAKGVSLMAVLLKDMKGGEQ